MFRKVTIFGLFEMIQKKVRTESPGPGLGSASGSGGVGYGCAGCHKDQIMSWYEMYA